MDCDYICVRMFHITFVGCISINNALLLYDRRVVLDLAFCVKDWRQVLEVNIVLCDLSVVDCVGVEKRPFGARTLDYH
jgi:hypothetical protein